MIFIQAKTNIEQDGVNPVYQFTIKKNTKNISKIIAVVLK
jgi:hypothetical protein